MTITISRADYDMLWQQANPQPQDLGGTSFSDIRRIVPERLGQGYIQSIQWTGVELTLFHYRFHEDVHILNRANNEDACVCEIGFHLSGNRRGKCTGENFIEWGSYDTPDKWIDVTYANEPILKADIHLEPSSGLSQIVADTLPDLPAEIRQCLEACGDSWLSEINMITPAMRVPLEQIFNCPFHGKTRQIYLESKCLELIALKLEQLKENDKRPGVFCSLKPDDINRIYRARTILKVNLDNPPSLMELARKVSLNDYKLKVGFRQIFGTTVFGYLHQYRMETARQLLQEQRLNVKEVARSVGYVSQSRFATAFRKEFGINPKAYLLSKKSG
ncbi:transcriptional family [Leptolyngbya sp. Heron Island J]|uniref:helix-turn-helix transcriptional regulator n=1 Tax=Leptolyngbya sp. Heron Island J TaxID=1385935 RepID=UPI0003B9B685|nr:AraC family transcriptional regulator [Leptolyngbya sp. Heron Island J]ESA33721.1 transcriptional family [Leptolyngbya sp. Heron Island J]